MAQRSIFMETACTSFIPGGMTFPEAAMIAPTTLRTMQLAMHGLGSE